MSSNGTGVVPPALAVDVELGRGLVQAEQSGALDPALWPALRQLLVTSTDPQIVSATAGLRGLLQAQQHYAAAYEALRAAVAHLPPPEDVDQVREAVEQLGLAAEDLLHRALMLQQARASHAGGKER